MQDKNEIIEYVTYDLLRDLRDCEDGTVTNVLKLYNALEYDSTELDESELFEVMPELIREAEKNHIYLEDPVEEKRVEELSYDADFIVRNKEGQIRCPKCGSNNTAWYIHGYPIYNNRIKDKIDRNKVALGGCVITSVKVAGKDVWYEPERRCNDCINDFGFPPVMVDRKTNTGEYYRDIFTGIEIEIKCEINPFLKKHIKITKKDDGAILTVYDHSEVYPVHTKEADIDDKTWEKISDSLFVNIKIQEWNEDYTNLDWLDGESWKVEISLTKNRKLYFCGTNGYPPNWNEFKDIFKEYLTL